MCVYFVSVCVYEREKEEREWHSMMNLPRYKQTKSNMKRKFSFLFLPPSFPPLSFFLSYLTDYSSSSSEYRAEHMAGTRAEQRLQMKAAYLLTCFLWLAHLCFSKARTQMNRDWNAQSWLDSPPSIIKPENDSDNTHKENSTGRIFFFSWSFLFSRVSKVDNRSYDTPI